MIKKDLFKNSNFIILIIVIISFIILLTNKLKTDNELFSNGIYTVGKILDIKAMKGGLVYYYEFSINGIYYNGDVRSGRLKDIGDKCFVIYNPDNFEQNKMLLLLPQVPDSINSTKKSWKKLPIQITDELIKRALR